MKKDAQNLYRRHRRACPGGHKEGSFSGEFEERKKGWKRCDCPIAVSGLVAGKFTRRSLAVSNWEQAREAAGAIQTPAPVATPEPVGRVTIEHAAKAWLASYAKHALSTQRSYKSLTKYFRGFSESKGYVYLDQWRPADIRQFRITWKANPTNAANKLYWYKTFFNFCLQNEWLEKNPAELIKTERGRAGVATDTTERVPFSDQDLDRMLDVCQRLYPAARRGRQKFVSQDLSDFISLSIYTGMRISDVATFHISRLRPNGEVRIRTTKTGTEVYTWVPEWLQQRIEARAKQFGPYIFGKNQSADISVITRGWQVRLNTLWDLCGHWETKPTHHRFRHTFARVLLEQDEVRLRDVAELLGNTEEVCRRRYSAWVKERQARLTHVLQGAFKDKPMPDNVVPFAKVV